MSVERIAAFVRGESDESFEALALAAFACQYATSASYRALCDRRGVTPTGVEDWRQVPAMPATEPAAGGTATAGAGERRLLESVIDRSFPAACLEGLERPPVLSLAPPRELALASGLARLADRVLERWAATDSEIARSRRGVEVAQARSFLAARQRDRRPTLLLASAAALTQLLDALDRRGLRFRLPPGSRAVSAVEGREGGDGPAAARLVARLGECLAVPAKEVVRAWQLGGVGSRFYAGHTAGGAPRPFRPPPWARVRVVAGEGLVEAAPGATGRLAVFDLAAVGAAVHRLGEEPAVAAGEGFHLAGRAGDAFGDHHASGAPEKAGGRPPGR